MAASSGTVGKACVLEANSFSLLDALLVWMGSLSAHLLSASRLLLGSPLHPGPGGEWGPGGRAQYSWFPS